MRYHGFATRDYLIVDNIQLTRDSSVMEIGVGTGSTIDLIGGEIKEYCGVDISAKTIEWLTSEYEHRTFVKWRCLDVCRDSSNLDRKYDVIFSADTLEHVESPQGYFNFIRKHLNRDGLALITYPNESEEEHHGITRVNSKKELLGLIEEAGLRAVRLCEVRRSGWHRFVKACLWEFPKLMLTRHKSSLQKRTPQKITPQTFEQTEAYRITRSHGFRYKMYAAYAWMVTRLAAAFTLYKSFDVGENIHNKNLLMILEHK